MGAMFSDCRALTCLDVSHFNTAKVTDMSGMFQTCSNLVTILVNNDWSTESVISSNNMFQNCRSLVGGKGTTYDANHTDAEYALIDAGAIYPGYFTSAVESIPGDADGEGVAGINDVTVIIDAILYSDYSSIDTEAADLDGDGNITINDIVILIDYILTGEWP